MCEHCQYQSRRDRLGGLDGHHVRHRIAEHAGYPGLDERDRLGGLVRHADDRVVDAVAVVPGELAGRRTDRHGRARGGVAACTTAEMPGGTWTLVPNSEGTGHVAADIALRNTSGHACTVTGFPGVSLLASDEHPLPTTVVRFPAAPAAVTVAPGGWIHSEVRYSPNIPGDGEPATGECEPKTVHALAQLPGDTKWAKITLAAPTTVCEKGSLEAKPFVAGQSTPAGG
ncbi:DUF4232 domain-containing protein [Catenulispora yoronensis]